MGHGKKKKQSKDTDHEEGSGDGEGRAAHQRPNCCDTLMLALVCFFMVVALAVSIPMLLAASGKADIEFINKKLKEVKEPNE
ncbi:hypothetical protein GCK72_006101 [Caenorhabditis remanei]|uniref:Uncharacterized protein n=2 Tax=Caenorhabditis remanei TaxID=31234 RepID=E3M4U2_CAERE|nr:hypothetical protein GCK72_006101 [Caenorhabditis remanei]EFO91599.1 hypothetical protein CRE_11981 [Caenorhabditis remanei]KAF1766145.1 hypothetical protein GCK72_006101 [Caenorhabditis remanei]